MAPSSMPIAAPGDTTAVVGTLRRVGQLVADFPGISEMDINLLIVGPEGAGAWAVDARIALDKEPECCCTPVILDV